MSIGLQTTFEGPSPSSDPSPTAVPELLAANEAQLQGLADQVRAVIAEHDLDDYAHFRIALEAIDSLPIQLGSGVHATAQALQHGQWSPSARMVALGALIRNLGFMAMPFVTADNQVILGLRFEDPIEQMNSAARKNRLQTRQGGRAPVTHDFYWLLFDGQSRIGVEANANPALPGGAWFEGPTQGFRFVGRKLPSFTLQAAEPAELRLYGGKGTLRYAHRPDALEYVKYAPSLRFEHHIPSAIQEVEALGMGGPLQELRAQIPDDHEFVTLLLRTLQAEFTFEVGALRSSLQILSDRRADCDQLSSILIGMLLLSGWSLPDIALLRWRGGGQLHGHVALGIRPLTGQPKNGATAYNLGGRGSYVALDAAYVRQDTSGNVLTEWGDLQPKYRNRGPQAVPLG